MLARELQFDAQVEIIRMIHPYSHGAIGMFVLSLRRCLLLPVERGNHGLTLHEDFSKVKTTSNALRFMHC